MPSRTPAAARGDWADLRSGGLVEAARPHRDLPYSLRVAKASPPPPHLLCLLPPGLAADSTYSLPLMAAGWAVLGRG
jgi:hypothetical protein